MARRAFNVKILPICLLCLLIVEAADAAAAARGFKVSSTASLDAAVQREFDYFALSLQWPGSYCQRTRHCCSSSACCRSNPLTEFTIHGLWPDYNDGNYPSCCRNSDFSIKKISSLVPELQKHWPSLSCGSASLCHGGKGLFWAHEWAEWWEMYGALTPNLQKMAIKIESLTHSSASYERNWSVFEQKHGTCSYPVILDEYSYFTAALDLYFKYNITRILSNEGILASNAENYSVENIISAIKKAVGALPLLECRRGSLEELQLCFDKKFKPRDCYLRSGIGDGETLSSRKSCPRNITLPIYTPLGNGLNGDASSAASWLSWNEAFIPFNVM